MTGPLDELDGWDVAHAAAAVVTPTGTVASHGDPDHRFQWASVTKLASAYATLVAVEEGSVDLDEPAGPPGATVRHLLAHTSGLPFAAGHPPPVAAAPGQRRIYSNAGFEVLADHVAAATAMPFATYLAEAVLEPLGMDATLEGSPATGLVGTTAALAALAAELLAPTLLDRATLAEATTVAYPGLRGVVPGFGPFDPCDWGLGFELRDGKYPHWTGPANSPATFGHFGQAGGFLWVDPVAGVAMACLTDRSFGPWAVAAWPPLADAVVGQWAERPIR
jgi:CubicO group peptidase (beta-lactamase class C family)